MKTFYGFHCTFYGTFYVCVLLLKLDLQSWSIGFLLKTNSHIICYLYLHYSFSINFYFDGVMSHFRFCGDIWATFMSAVWYKFSPPSWRHRAMIFARKLLNGVNDRSQSVLILSNSWIPSKVAVFMQISTFTVSRTVCSVFYLQCDF